MSKVDVREKLVELLKGSKLCSKRFDDQYSDSTIAIVADHLIAHGVTVQEWISVKDRLPENPGKYLVCGRCFGNKTPQIWICECIRIGSVMGWCNNVKNPVVEAWTTLPQPPKGE